MESWLKQSGASGLDDLELADFLDTGRGVRTLRRFEEGEKILTIPHDVLWTVEHAFADPFLGPALLSTLPPLSVDDTLATYILFVRSRGSGYDGLRSHVAALPANYTSSVFFAEAELELDRQIEDDHRELVVRLFGRYQELFLRDKFTIEDYKWALCTVWSRAIDFKLPDGGSIRLLAPFADMLNHSPEVKQCHVYDSLSGNLSVLAGENYESGDQLFINYGSIPNNRLLLLYGFVVVPGNRNDSYDLVLTTLDSTSTISLTLTNPLPRSVLRYLRIQRLHESELAIIAPYQSDAAVEKISDSNEAEVLRILVESISDLLDGFGTQLEKLEEQLAEGLGEQRVLRLTKKITEDLLATVESGSGNERGLLSAPPQCAKCEKVSVQLMRCGRCNKVMYCGRACQVAHYKEHKAMCRAAASGIGSDRN
ncbi:hypothetical protein BKA65DRAFT_571145 [Rhexocercosporidium sp. MPI-PUGE-AT-0058]|nr:hypothetical protein BKA65DRAFT_571145 [Rhexocercosporidium sp. MPI-PUGE-AT-0058]